MQSFEAGRIFCIGKNYSEHIRELAGTVPEEPVVFMKPASSLVRVGEVVRLPVHGSVVHHEVEAVALIGREGRDIPESSALEHVAGITLGLDLTLRDVQSKLKNKGLPWELSKAFEQSAPIGAFSPVENFPNLQDIEFSCSVNGCVRQRGNTGEMIYPLVDLISFLSRVWHLVPGDMIFTGTPAGVGPIRSGDTVVLQGEFLAEFSWQFV